MHPTRREWNEVNKVTMKGAINTLTGVLVLSLLLFFSAFSVSAWGVGIAPAELQITDALRGAEYERTVTVINTDEATAKYNLGTEGEAATWISFYELGTPDKPLETISIPGKENADVLVRFDIPMDVPNGIYQAVIYAETSPSEEKPGGETGAISVLWAPASVTIEVGGTQVLSGVVQSIHTDDVEINYPLRLKVRFNNTGNIIANPQIGIKIIKNGFPIDEFTSAETGVKAGQNETINVEWDTTGHEIGDYTASITVVLGGDIIGEEEVKFAILPVGTLTRAGTFNKLILQGEAKPKAIAIIEATFANSGQIDTLAKFIGEVYCDGELIETIESDEILIPVGEWDVLKSYLSLEKLGDYQIQGYINYEGKKTETKEISFAVASSSEVEPEVEQRFSFFPPAIGVVGFLLIIIIYMAVRRRRQPTGQ